MSYAIHIDIFRSEPGKTECWEAIWSNLGACRECDVNCYRKGWAQARVGEDNLRLVTAKLFAQKDEPCQ